MSFRRNFSFLTTSVLLFSSLTLYASNRDLEDKVFDEPQRGEWAQIWIGGFEYFAAEMIRPQLGGELKSVKAAEFELKITRHLATSDSQRVQALEAILNNPHNFYFKSDVGKVSELKKGAAELYQRVKSTEIMTKVEKTALIESAKKEVANARTTALTAARNKGLLHKGVKFLRMGTSIILYGDFLARIYIWNALKADPTYFPVATYLKKKLEKDSNQ